MRRITSAFIAASVFISSLAAVYVADSDSASAASDSETITIERGADIDSSDNLLSDSRFDNDLSTSSRWTFSDKGKWYRYGNEASLVEAPVYSQSSAVSLGDSVVGQRVELEKKHTYRFSVLVYTENAPSVKLVIYDGSKSVPGSSLLTEETKTLTSGEWQEIHLDYTCLRNQDYVFVVYGTKSTVAYVDDAMLYEVEEETAETVVPTPEITDYVSEMLTYPGFENGAFTTASSWNFNSKSKWSARGSTGKYGLEQENTHSGEYSFMIEDAYLGQGIALENGKSYKLTAYVLAAADANIEWGFYDGTKSTTASNKVNTEAISVSSSDEWQKIEMTFTPENTQDYVVLFYEKGVKVYIDDVSLVCTTADEIQPEAEKARVTVHNKVLTESEIIYNIAVAAGTRGDLIAAVYDTNGRMINAKTVKSSDFMNITVSNEGKRNGVTRFYLWDAKDDLNPISLLAEDEWEYTDMETEITLNYNTYPLVVGNASTTADSAWDGYGGSVTLTAQTDSDEDITWTVSDPEIIAVTETDGKSATVQARRTGSAAVTAALPDGSSATCYINVLDNFNRIETQRIELNADTIRLAEGASAELTTIFYPKDVHNTGILDRSCTWQSSDPETASVSKGVVTANKQGTAVITVISKDVGRTASCTVTVLGSVDTTGITQTETGVVDLTVGDTAQLHASADGDSRIIWKSDNTYIADVDENGVVTAYSNSNRQVVGYHGMEVTEEPDTVNIYATTRDGGYTAVYKLRVSDAPVEAQTVVINKDRINLAVGGGSKNITAVVAPSHILDPDISWSSSDTGVVRAEKTDNTIYGANQAILTPVSAGTATITASYGGRSDTCTVTVTDSVVYVESIGLEPAKSIEVDEVYKLETAVTDSATEQGLFWIDTDEDIVTVGRDGTVMGYKTGNVKVYAVAVDKLTDEQITALKTLKYDNRQLTDSEITSAVIGAYYEVCTLTVTDDTPCLRNLHIPAESVTDSSVNILWNSIVSIDLAEAVSYNIYCDDELIDSTDALDYTAEGLEPSMEYTFRVDAVKANGSVAASKEVTAQTKPQSEVINVIDYGAKGNGLVMDTYAIQKAINACPAGGTVYLPGDGRIYCSGALFLKDNMTFKVDGVILGSIDPKDYPNRITRWEGWRKVEQTAEEWDNFKISDAVWENHIPNSSLINIGTYDEGDAGEASPANAHDIVICGSGQINGNGFSLAYNEGPNHAVDNKRTDYPVKDATQRGRTITIHNAENVYIKDILVSYSPSWTIHPIYCNNLTFDGITVISMSTAQCGEGTGARRWAHIYNGDGIDVESSENVNVTGAYFMAGDDSVILKSGRNREGNELDKPNAYVRVTDCECHHCIGGYGIGSENASGAHDILFQNLAGDHLVQDGIWFKTGPQRGGTTENIQVRDIFIENCGYVVDVSDGYTSDNNVNVADNNLKMRNMTFENIGGWGAYGMLTFSARYSKHKIEDVTVRGITMTQAGTKGNSLEYCKDIDITTNSSEEMTWSRSGCENITIDGVNYP